MRDIRWPLLAMMYTLNLPCCNCTACAAHCSRLQFSVAVWQRQIMSTRLMLCSTTEMAPDPYALITDVYLDDEL